MRGGSKILPALFAVVVTICVFIPMVSAKMKWLVSIRFRLNRILSGGELSKRQYDYIIDDIASDEILDFEIGDSYDMNITAPSLSEEKTVYFCEWINQEEADGNMTEGTSDLIRNLFDCGYGQGRSGEVPLSKRNGPVPANYNGNGVVEFIARSGDFAPSSSFRYSGIWGYKRGNREYALQCDSIGLNILDVTNTTIIKIQTIPMSGGIRWRDVATHQDYAYVAAQGGPTADAYVVKLSQLSRTLAHGADSNPISQYNIKNIGNTDWGHTINVWSGLLFLNSAQYGCRIFDLSNPMNPSLLTTYTGGDCHDSYVQKIGKKNILFPADGGVGRYRLIDITNIRTSPQLPFIGQTRFSAGIYAHSNVVSDDGKIMFAFDESNEVDIAAYDISVLSRPKLISKFQWSGEYKEGNSKVHNGAIQGNNLIVAYYNAGLRIFDITDVYKIREIGKYETYRDPDGDGNFDNNITDGSYNGSWNVAILQSGKILISDTTYGTFLVKINTAPSAEPAVEPSPGPSRAPVPVFDEDRCIVNNRRSCLQRGCYWQNKKCRSCAKIASYSTCMKRSCVWTEGKCAFCDDAKLNRKNCASTKCVWKKKQCISCTVIMTQNECKDRRCKWNIDKKICGY